MERYNTQVSKKKCKCDDELQLVIQQRLCQDHLRMGRTKKKMWGTQGDDKYTVCPIYCNDVYIRSKGSPIAQKNLSLSLVLQRMQGYY